MFIGFPAIADEQVELGSLASDRYLHFGGAFYELVLLAMRWTSALEGLRLFCKTYAKFYITSAGIVIFYP